MRLKNIYLKKNQAYTLLKILIIEDDEATGDVLQSAFKMAGYICQIQSTGRNILSLVKHVLPNIIIMDYLLPEINGADLCRELKNDKITKAIPVIIYSAYPEVLRVLQNSCYDDFIAKPFDLDDLILRVELLMAFKTF